MRIRGGNNLMIWERCLITSEGNCATSSITQHSKWCFVSRSLVKTPAPTSMSRNSRVKELCKGAHDHDFMLIIVDSTYRKPFWNGRMKHFNFEINLNSCISSYSGPTIIHKLTSVALLIQIVLIPAESPDSLMSSSAPDLRTAKGQVRNL